MQRTQENNKEESTVPLYRDLIDKLQEFKRNGGKRVNFEDIRSNEYKIKLFIACKMENLRMQNCPNMHEMKKDESLTLEERRLVNLVCIGKHDQASIIIEQAEAKQKSRKHKINGHITNKSR